MNLDLGCGRNKLDRMFVYLTTLFQL